MKKLILLLSLFSTVAFGVDRIISAPSGNLVLDSKSGSKIIIKKEIQTDVASPGFVPVGGMVAVMPNIQATDAWQPPATGVIKDGFMRADGHTITAQNVTDGSKLRAGTVLPNMTAKYPRGNTTSGGTGGNNTQASNVTGTAPAHYHGFGTGSGMSAAGQSYTGSSGGHAHTTSFISSGALSGTGADVRTLPQYGNGPQYNLDSDTRSVTINHTHAASSVSGNVGLVTGGSNGNSAMTLSLTNNTVNNEPAYVETVWVIRVM